MMKIFLILALAFCFSTAISVRSRVLRILSVKWSFDILAVLLLGSVNAESWSRAGILSLTLIGMGVLVSFLWFVMKLEGGRDRGRF